MQSSVTMMRPQRLPSLCATKSARGAAAARGAPMIVHAASSPSQEPSIAKSVASKMFAAAAAATLATSSVAPLAAHAGEFDLLASPKPTSSYVIDDAQVLNRTTRKSLNDSLVRLETSTGYRLTVATVRKLEVEGDAFALGDKLVEHWYPTVQEGGNKGVLLLVTAAKDGALTGGPAFLKAVGDDLIDSVVGDNLPILAGDEKFNEAVSSSVKRVEAKLTGSTDPGPPARKDGARKRTYKTRQETDKTRNVTATIVLSLLAISVVVPMLQYYGYTSDE